MTKCCRRKKKQNGHLAEKKTLQAVFKEVCAPEEAYESIRLPSVVPETFSTEPASCSKMD